MHRDQRPRERDRETYRRHGGVARSDGGPQHQQHEHQPGDRIGIESPERMLDLRRGVAEQIDGHPRREGRPEACDQRVDFVTDAEAVRLLFFANGQHDRRFPVHPSTEVSGGKGVAYLCYVADAHRAAACVWSNDDRRELFDVIDARHPAHEPSVPFALGRSDGDVRGAKAQRMGHRRERKLVSREPVGVDLHAELPVSNSVAPDPGNARQAFDPVGEILADLPEHHLGDLPAYRDHDRREVDFELAYDRPFCIDRQVVDAVDLVRDLHDRGRHVVDVRMELEAHVRDTFFRRAPDLVDLVDVADGMLDGDRDELLDLLRRGARIDRGDRAPAGGHRGQRLAMHRAQYETSDDHHGDRHEVDEHGLTDCEGRNAHGSSMGTMWTSEPSTTRVTPLLITTSPTSTPSTTSA